MTDQPFHHRRLGLFDHAVRATGAVLGFLRSDIVVVSAAVIVTVVMSVVLTATFQILSLSRPSKSSYTAKPSDYQLDYRAVALSSADGTPLAAWFVPSKQATKQAVLVLHGYGSNKSEMLPRTAFLAEHYNLLFLDFRFFGESGGQYSTFGPKEQQDAASALTWLRAQGYDSLGVYGFSLGGTVALTSLATVADVRCAAAESPYGNARLMMEEAYGSFGPLRETLTDATVWLAAYVGFDLSADHIATSLKPIRKPALVIASRTDNIIPPGHLYAIKTGLEADPQAEYLEFDGRQHGEIAPGFGERMLAFFGQCLN